MSYPTYPDYGRQAGQLPGLSPDLAEMAARSGYPSVRRTGKVICRDSCELQAPYGPVFGFGFRVAAENQYAGDGCFEFSPAAGFVEIWRQFPPLDARTMGLELFVCGDSTAGNRLQVTMQQDYGAGLVVKLRVDFANQALQLWDTSIGNYATVLNIGQAGYWHNLKITLDWQAQRIIRLWWDDTSLAINKPLSVAGGSGKQGVVLKFRADNFLGASRSWIDEISLTVDESEV